MNNLLLQIRPFESNALNFYGIIVPIVLISYIALIFIAFRTKDKNIHAVLKIIWMVLTVCLILFILMLFFHLLCLK